KLLPEYIPVEEQDRAQGLLVRRNRHMTLVRQMCEKAFDLGFAQPPRMPHTVVAKESTRPVHIRLLRAKAVVKISNAFSKRRDQSGRSRFIRAAAGRAA